MREHPVRRALTCLGQWMAYPGAFLMVPLYGVLWFTFDKESWNWHAIAVLATWFMTLLIQRSEYRDTVALHAKLDELLRVEGKARNELISIDEKDLEEVENKRNNERALSATQTT
jgi:low affinity Fe/Cu permease